MALKELNQLFGQPNIITPCGVWGCISLWFSICISLMAHDARHLFLCFLGIRLFSLEKPIQIPCPFFNWAIFLFFLFYVPNLLGWQWLIRLHRFQVYNSKIYHLYIMHCMPTTQHQILHHYIFDPFFPLLPSPCSPLITSILLSVLMSVCFSFCSFVAFSFISHQWLKSYGS